MLVLIVWLCVFRCVSLFWILLFAVVLFDFDCFRYVFGAFRVFSGVLGFCCFRVLSVLGFTCFLVFCVLM